MRLSQFVDLFVAALYNETQRTGQSDFRVGEIVAKYGLELNPGWGERLFNDDTFASHVEASRTIGPPLQQNVSLSSRGFRWVEDELGENVAAFLERNGATYTQPVPENALTTEDGDPIVTEDGDYILMEDTAEAELVPRIISSEEWTGIANRIGRDAAVASRINKQIIQLDKEVDRLGLSNHERAKVKAITESLTKLVASPEPEWKAIVELLRSPTLAAIVGLVGIAQLALKIIFGIG
ncbi:MAG: hypothetical protein ABR588_02150 [Sphingomicrobium sp.]|nr:hypothetical protein [Sphingomonadales bacterium]